MSQRLDRKVRDLMTRSVVLVHQDQSAEEALELMRAESVSSAPVEDAEGKLVGLLSVADIANAAVAEVDLAADRSDPDFLVRGWEERANPDEVRKLHIMREGRLVRDLMSTELVTASEETSARDLARLMVTHRIHRVPVLAGDRLVGIISSLDLLAALIEES